MAWDMWQVPSHCWKQTSFTSIPGVIAVSRWNWISSEKKIFLFGMMHGCPILLKPNIHSSIPRRVGIKKYVIIMTVQTSFSNRYGPIAPPLHKAYQTVTPNGCIFFCKTMRGFSKAKLIQNSIFFEKINIIVQFPIGLSSEAKMKRIELCNS